jgi:hypothetical protein
MNHQSTVNVTELSYPPRVSSAFLQEDCQAEVMVMGKEGMF